MDAAKMKEILKKEYGINNQDEFNTAVTNFNGINLGIFTMPLTGRSVISEHSTEAKVTT